MAFYQDKDIISELFSTPTIAVKRSIESYIDDPGKLKKQLVKVDLAEFFANYFTEVKLSTVHIGDSYNMRGSHNSQYQLPTLELEFKTATFGVQVDDQALKLSFKKALEDLVKDNNLDDGFYCFARAHTGDWNITIFDDWVYTLFGKSGPTLTEDDSPYGCTFKQLLSKIGFVTAAKTTKQDVIRLGVVKKHRVAWGSINWQIHSDDFATLLINSHEGDDDDITPEDSKALMSEIVSVLQTITEREEYTRPFKIQVVSEAIGSYIIEYEDEVFSYYRRSPKQWKQVTGEDLSIYSQAKGLPAGISDSRNILRRIGSFENHKYIENALGLSKREDVLYFQKTVSYDRDELEEKIIKQRMNDSLALIKQFIERDMISPDAPIYIQIFAHGTYLHLKFTDDGLLVGYVAFYAKDIDNIQPAFMSEDVIKDQFKTLKNAARNHTTLYDLSGRLSAELKEEFEGTFSTQIRGNGIYTSVWDLAQLASRRGSKILKDIGLSSTPLEELEGIDAIYVDIDIDDRATIDPQFFDKVQNIIKSILTSKSYIYDNAKYVAVGTTRVQAVVMRGTTQYQSTLGDTKIWSIDELTK